jgi:3-hydroxy-9,10-secoandrosta-1,3,5(10)-triene-9,17-dione monooxygenase reductase component
VTNASHDAAAGPASSVSTESGSETLHRYVVGSADDAGAVDGSLYRQVMGQFLAGVTVITAMNEGVPVGMAASSFTSLSMEPPLVLFCPGKNSGTWARIAEAGHYAVNILGAEHESVSRQMASKSDDKFAGLAWHTEASGCPVLDDALGWIDCRTEHIYDGGDHWIVVGRVLALGWRDGDPLAYHRGAYGTFAK